MKYYITAFSPDHRTLVDRHPVPSLDAAIDWVHAHAFAPTGDACGLRADHVEMAPAGAAVGIYTMSFGWPDGTDQRDAHRLAWMERNIERKRRDIRGVLIEREDCARDARSAEVGEGNRPAPLR